MAVKHNREKPEAAPLQTGSYVRGVKEGMLLSSDVDMREGSGRAFVRKPPSRLKLNVVIASDEDS